MAFEKLQSGRQSKAWPIQHPKTYNVGRTLQEWPGSLFTEGVGGLMERLSYGKQIDRTQENEEQAWDRHKIAASAGLDFL